MRKTLAIVAVVLGCWMLLGAPAAAQRDPFQPPAGFGTSAGETGGDTAPAPDTDPAPAPAERLADTGTETGPWLAMAYVLLAGGAGVLVASRLAAVPTK